MANKYKRRLIPGVQTRGPRALARRVATPKVKYLAHGGKSRSLLRDPLDGRTAVARAHRQRVAAYCSHLGGDVTATQARLVEQASRLSLLADAAWGAVARAGPLKDGRRSPAVDAFLRASREEREVLRLLGLERRARPVPSLQEYIEAKEPGDG